MSLQPKSCKRRSQMAEGEMIEPAVEVSETGESEYSFDRTRHRSRAGPTYLPLYNDHNDLVRLQLA